MRSKVTRELSTLMFEAVPSLATGEYVKGRTITTGCLKRSIWKVCWPLLVISASAAVVDLVHVQCAGYINAGAQAVIGICDQLLAMGMIVLSALAACATAFVSRAAGRDGIDEIENITAQSIRLALFFGTGLAFLVFFTAPYVLVPFSGCVNDCSETLGSGTKYLSVSSFTLMPFGILAAINACFMGIGFSRIQLVTMLVLTLVDVALTYSFVVLGWPVSGVGITSIGIASLTANLVALIVALVMMNSSQLKGVFSRLTTHDQKLAVSIVTSGMPPALQEMAWAGSAFVLYYFLSLLADSTDVVAALNIGQRLESCAFVPLTALGSALLVIAGQNIGAGRIKRAFNSSVGAASVSAGLMVAGGLILFFSAPQLATLAHASDDTLPYVVDYLKVAACGLFFVGLETVLSGVLQALNDTRVPVIFGFVSNWIICLPLTYTLAIAMKQGPHGAWLAILAGNVVSGVATFLRFYTRPEWRQQPKAPAAEVFIDQSISGLIMDAVVDEADDKISRGRPCQELRKPGSSD